MKSIGEETILLLTVYLKPHCPGNNLNIRVKSESATHGVQGQRYIYTYTSMSGCLAVHISGPETRHILLHLLKPRLVAEIQIIFGTV